MDGLPVEHRRGDYLSVGPVDGQPVCGVVQLRIPKDAQGRVNGGGFFFFFFWCSQIFVGFSEAGVHTEITGTLLNSQQPDLHTL